MNNAFIFIGTILLFSFSACKKEEAGTDTSSKQIQFFKVGNLWVYEKEISDPDTSYMLIDSIYIKNMFVDNFGDTLYIFMIKTINPLRQDTMISFSHLGNFSKFSSYVFNESILTDYGNIFFNNSGTYNKLESSSGGCNYYTYRKTNEPKTIVTLNKTFNGYILSKYEYCEEYLPELTYSGIEYANGIGIINIDSFDRERYKRIKQKLIYFSGLN